MLPYIPKSDAQYETEAVLDQVMYHNNTAPFLSIRLIQRLGISNPSPRYVQSVSSAFISGSYTTVGFNDSVSFGTGQYGDLSATIAAILLDRESRSAVLDADFSHGSIREPLVKVIATMRSLEYTHSDTSIEYLSLFELESKIGQMAHHSPSVFSFFLPEYAPGGVIEKAGLVSPESMLLHKSIGLSNGLTSLVNFG
jgi:cullin-associated NEDD8-dissociated protein 1